MALTLTAPETVMSEPAPMNACTAAAEVTSASTEDPAPAKKMPMVMTNECAVALLVPSACTVSPLPLETVPENDAVVAPAIVAVGRLTPSETKPPEPMSDAAVAVLLEIASKSMSPPEATVPTPVDVTEALPPIREMAAPPLRAASPRPATNALPRTTFTPWAVTVTDEEPTTLPSSVACTPPSMRASATMTPAVTSPTPIECDSASA